MNKETVLIVDDVEMNRIILENILEDTYTVKQADGGLEAISFLFSAAVIPSIILLDIMMPEMDGYEVLEMIKSNPLTRKIPVLFVSAADTTTNESRGLSMGAVDYIPKPFDPEVVRIRVANQIRLKNYTERMERLVDDKVTELVRTKERVLELMATIIEYRSLESGHHVKRTSGLTGILMDHLANKNEFGKELDNSEFEVIKKAVQLHDVGKIAIPDRILLKPARLTPEEYEIIKTHSSIGGEILKSLLETDKDPYLQFCYDIARHHHERWDGTGYPDKLKGTDSPLAARVLAVVDVYDALVSARVYKQAYTHEQAMSIIAQGAGTQFDPEIVNALIEVEHLFENFK